MSFLSTAVQRVLEEGRFCAVATTTPHGPHLTPLVFAYSGGRIWLTTSRAAVKTRVWRTDPSVSGLIRHEDLAVTFTGSVKTYDALDRGTWAAAVSGATSIARATATFSRKNARFFAGYAFDARQVPLAWTPPGRVFVGIDIERTALLDADGVQEGRGRWGGEAGSRAAFRRPSDPAAPLEGLPAEIATEIGSSGMGSLALSGDRGPVVLPVGWRVEPHGLYAAIPAESLALAGAASESPVALTIDRVAEWRARDMVGTMIQGTGTSFVGGAVGSGSKSVASIAHDIAPGADSLVRVAPARLVWWKGWSSGSASLG